MRALLPLALIATPATAQIAPPVAAATPASTSVEEATGRLATDASGMRMTVPVTIAGAGPFAFLIDTGAQRTVISRELARTLGLAAGRSVRVTAMTGVSPAATVVIPSIAVSPGAIAGTRIEAPAFLAADIGAAGLLGIDTLRDRRVVIDLDARTMSVAASTKRRRPPDDDVGEIVVRARSLLGQLVVTDAYVGPVRVRLVLDTGSVASIGNLALRRRLSRTTHPVSTISLVSVLGERLTADYTAIDHVRIGDLSIEALPVAYADAAPFRQLGLLDRPAILLGMDAIGLFRRVEIDFANREVRLLLPLAIAQQRRAGRRLMGLP